MKQKNIIYFILFLSISANIFIGGYLIGHNAHSFYKKKPHHDMVFKGMIKELPSESKKTLGTIIKKSKSESRENRRQIYIERQRLLELMSEPNLQEEQIKQSLDLIESHSVNNLKIAQNVLYEVITNASFEDRLKMVDAIKKRKQRYKHRHKRNDG